MSPKSRRRIAARRRAHAPVFAALGDETRLSLIAKLCGARPRSIARLTEGSKLTRQAITKHLCVLERAGIVHRVRRGRECLFALDPEPIEKIKEYLERVSAQWDQALARLKAFVENRSGSANLPSKVRGSAAGKGSASPIPRSCGPSILSEEV